MNRIGPSLVAILCGVIFGAGLGLSQMTQPSKVLGFLDFTGAWDPSLALVMGAAVLVHFVGLRLVGKKPLFDERFHPPTSAKIDRRLVAGAALFGVGWGLSGLCPGPAVVSAVSGAVPLIAFVAAMLLGMALEHTISKRDS